MIFNFFITATLVNVPIIATVHAFVLPNTSSHPGIKQRSDKIMFQQPVIKKKNNAIVLLLRWIKFITY